VSLSPFAVLGIDAAWTERAPSGVALVEVRGGRAKAVFAAPSYETFVRGGIDWTARQNGGLCDAAALLAAARRLTGLPIRCVAVDMALSRAPITGRRAADNLTSSAFGRYWCGTHSPSAVRPGRVSDDLRRGFENEGFALATSPAHLPLRALLEVHPHAALVRLMREERRLPYKLARLRQYYPGASAAERRARLLATWRRIARAVGSEVEGTGALLPMRRLAALPVARLKAVEDALDAVICAWVGAEVARGNADAFGDESAAIWVPRAPVSSRAQRGTPLNAVRRSIRNRGAERGPSSRPRARRCAARRSSE
jgi:predicted RNase H-like nuclease